MEHVIEQIQAYLHQTRCSLNQLARMAGIPQPVLHRIVHGQTTNPRMQTIVQIAQAMHVPVSHFFGKEGGAPAGIPLYEAPGLAQERHTTILSWHDGDTNDLFALKAWDDSMAPIFPKDCQLIFHRGRAAQHHDYVLIKGPAYWLFRQLILDGKQQHLYALNPSMGSTDFNDEEKIIAVLVESRMQFATPPSPNDQDKKGAPTMHVVGKKTPEKHTVRLAPSSVA